VDLQSSPRVGWLPSGLRRPLERIDFGGIYKHWSRLAPDSMPAGEATRVQRERHRSRWWVFNKWPLLAPLHKLFNSRILWMLGTWER
jgi:hypothetical protein